MLARRCSLAALVMMVVLIGCRTKYREDLDYSYNVQQTWHVEDLLHGDVVQFESVFWEPDDTVSLRKLIVEDTIAAGRDVLEIGTGTGLLSILCLQNDAASVVATDINPAAVANARYNAAMLCPDQELIVRQVDSLAPGAYSVVEANERFDLIISNPPWEDGVVVKPADYAFYDPEFELMKSILDGLTKHLKPGGRCLLAYGHRPAVERLEVEAAKRNFEFKILDERELETLDTDFLPGMLVEVRPPLSMQKAGPSQAKAKDSSADRSEQDTAADDEDQAPSDSNGT